MESWIRQVILATVPHDGSRIGNQSLIQQVLEAAQAADHHFREESIQAVRTQLIAEGVLGKGGGRGGSVYRIDAADTLPPTQSDNASEAPATESASSSGNDQYGTYRHGAQATLRPDVGVQDQFSLSKKPRQYRYDSSLAPELIWNENAERDFAEWLLNLIAEAAQKGEAEVFEQEQRWLGTHERFTSIGQCVARLKSLTRPFLNWAGKAERQRISVPTVPLFIHERHATRAILERLQSYKLAGEQFDMFGDPQLDIADKLDAYEHKGPWTNRLILGDSLQVMNSLLEYEGLGSQVQMIYIDPPYGVKFGSNFQPFVRKRDVKHGRDDEMIREPEMVKAYRDTWELGLHSYLSYLRDRLLLARELLTESGSVFVQISDENLHHVREVMDEIYGPENFLSVISFKKTGGFSAKTLANVTDYIIWFAKDRERIKYNPIYEIAPAPSVDDPNYVWLELSDGKIRRMTPEERRREHKIPEDARVFRYGPLTSDGASKSPQEFEFEGQYYLPGSNSHWKTTIVGMKNLAERNLLLKSGKKGLAYKLYWSNFPVQHVNNIWLDTQSGGFNDPKTYVVQTTNKTIQRCLLMTTDPGDLVLDPTCGSGTTAYVAEQWGRRWITCDTSRVPLALTRQRLLTATFPWYELKEPQRGPAGGFAYRRKQNRKGEEIGGLVPRITLKSIANDEPPETVTLVDRPEINNKVTRVCGPFSVEATIQAAALLDETAASESAEAPAVYDNPRAYLDRMIEVLRRSHTLRLPGNLSLTLDAVRPLTDCEWLHAEALTGDDDPRRIAVAFGPEDGAIDSQFVYEAAREAHFLRYDQLYLFGFAIQAKAREMIEDRAKLRIACAYINVTPDVVMTDLLKTSHTDQIFSLTGLPDIKLNLAGRSDTGEPLFQVELLGLDTFRPDTLETESVAAENLPCWMLDTDYNGMVFCASQVFFPRTGAWDNLKQSLRADFDDSVWDHLAGTESEPFLLGEQRRIAVKVIDERGNELMVVRTEAEAQG